MPPDWLINLGSQLFLAGAIYGGIRIDIKNLHEGIREAKDAATGAHGRIDSILMKKG